MDTGTSILVYVGFGLALAGIFIYREIRLYLRGETDDIHSVRGRDDSGA